MSEWDSSVLHADLDAFYASVEVLRNPELRGKPVIVGGVSSRGVVTSASYEARKFGVHSAMPTSRARRICPGGIFVQPDFQSYIEKSKQVREVFDSFSHIVEPLALDEAFLQIKKARRMWPNPATLAEALKDRILRSTGLVVSVGVGPNKFVAKLASRNAKPDGILILRPHQVEDFLNPLRVDELWGVGEQTALILTRLGLKTVGDVAKVPGTTLEKVLGTMGSHIAKLSRGRDDRPVVPAAPRKSLGAEETFDQDLTDAGQVLRRVLKLSDRVAGRLRAQGISGKTVTLKIRLSNFKTLTRSKTLPHEIDTSAGIFHVAKELVQAESRRSGAAGTKIRLVGVSISNLSEWPAAEQLSLQRHPEWTKADRALDRVRFRFGQDAISFGALLDWEDDL